MTNKYFTARNLDDLKSQYRRLAMKHHPDRGGSVVVMQEINAEYDALFAILKDAHNATPKARQTTETPEEFRLIIDRLIKLSGLVVELCGSWLWISGNTKQHRDELKKAGCRWSHSKTMWYWRHEENGYHGRGGNTSIGDIRNKYGSQIFSADGTETTTHKRVTA